MRSASTVCTSSLVPKVLSTHSSVSSGVTGSEMEFTVTRNTASLPLSSTVLPSESVEAS